MNNEEGIVIEFVKPSGTNNEIKLQETKLQFMTQLIEIIESLDKNANSDKLKKSQTIRVKSLKGNDYVFSITKL